MPTDAEYEAAMERERKRKKKKKIKKKPDPTKPGSIRNKLKKRRDYLDSL